VSLFKAFCANLGHVFTYWKRVYKLPGGYLIPVYRIARKIKKHPVCSGEELKNLFL
jgi:hypothetical protein